MMFRTIARALPVAFPVHVAEEAPGFTASVRRNASPRYSQRDFGRTKRAAIVAHRGDDDRHSATVGTRLLVLRATRSSALRSLPPS